MARAAVSLEFNICYIVIYLFVAELLGVLFGALVRGKDVLIFAN